MKFLKLGDLHFGVKQDDPWVQNLQRDAIRQAIDYSKANGITKWLQAGDWFDVRKAITHKCMEFTREIATEIMGAGITVDVIVGNHDMAMKQKIHPNACTELLTQFSNFTIYDKITTVDYDSLKIDMVPWICDENREEILEYMKTTEARYCLGHFELNGFYFYKGMKSHGSEPDFLRRYKRVWSGHFHTQSSNKNVDYIGTPYTLTAGDENDIRGFWVFDTETEESSFVPNTTTWHKKIYYPCSVNPRQFKDVSLRVVVEKMDKDLVAFESALEEVVHELKVIVKVDTSVETTEGCVEDEIKTLPDLMEEYVDALPDVNDADIDATKIIVKQLYLEASK